MIETKQYIIADLPEAIKKVKDVIFETKYGYEKTDGLYFDLANKNIVATNNHKMKIAKLDCEPSDLKFRITKDCALILAKYKGIYKVSITDKKDYNSIQFEHIAENEFSSKLKIITMNISGTYPDYQKLAEDHKDKVKIYA